MKAEKNESVKVAIRVRPLNERETKMASPICVDAKDNILSIKKKAEAKEFVFDYVFGIQTRQQKVYETCAYSIVENALEGFNGTMFAYGQTGAGKTFTMVGDYTDPDWKGIIPRGFDHVITAIQTSQTRKYIVRSSFIQIYNQDIFDLLDAKGDVKKDLKESPQSGIFIKDLKCVPVRSVEEMFRLLDYGNKNRTTAKTNMNATSSRSHALFTVHIESLEGADKIKASKLNFVDLAGSERQGKTGATGDTLKEGAKINLSLTALGNVINALVDGKSGHIPYRDSKLTRLLQDSLGGNTKTLMLASVSPAEDNYDETMSTLRYAARARNIKNSPKINEDPKDALIREYMAEIEKLKKQLGSGGVSADISESSDELYQQLERASRDKEKQLNEKEAQMLVMRLKMKEMEELLIKKEKDTPEMIEKAKKRRLEKKKIMKNEELNENRVHDLQEQEGKDLQEGEVEEGKDVNFWKSMAKRLKKKLKDAIKDKVDLTQQFQEERQRLNECIRNFQGNLSFYKQIAEKFMSQSDISALKEASNFDFQRRQYIVPAFLLHDEKLNLPKTLKKHEVQDLWQQKRKGYKLKFLEKLPNLEESNTLLKIPESKSAVFSKEVKEPVGNPFLQNRRILRYINPHDQKYKSKQYNTESQRQTFFRRTNFLMREASNSQNKRPPSASFRVTSRAKLEALEHDRSKGQSSVQQGRSGSRGREKLQPIGKKG